MSGWWSRRRQTAHGARFEAGPRAAEPTGHPVGRSAPSMTAPVSRGSPARGLAWLSSANLPVVRRSHIIWPFGSPAGGRRGRREPRSPVMLVGAHGPSGSAGCRKDRAGGLFRRGQKVCGDPFGGGDDNAVPKLSPLCATRRVALAITGGRASWPAKKVGAMLQGWQCHRRGVVAQCGDHRRSPTAVR